MATILDSSRPRHQTDGRFFLIMACVMSGVIVAGFSLNLAMGRSSFAVPAIYHIHAVVFFSWIVLFLAQNWSIAFNNVRLHVTLGLLAYILVPVMIALGLAITVTSLRLTGAPFFFDQNQFAVSNSLMLLLFGVLAIAALRTRRYTGWHRRLMLLAMSILTGPGLGRLLPMPLLVPNAWHIAIAATLIFPLIGMIVDKRRFGQVHPAYLWGTGAIIVTQIIADIVAYSTFGIGVTQALVEGTAGEERPMAAFIPAGMSF